MRRYAALLMLVAANATRAQQFDFGDEIVGGEGWSGFLNVAFLGGTLLTLVVASVLGAIIAYHPRQLAVTDTIDEIDAPKVYVLYAVIGAIIGILVVSYGLVVGFVLFGIGGLIRFRTVLRSANLTGRVILVTLIGLSCGLDLPHVAVLATAFAYVLIYMVEARTTYRIEIQALAPERVSESAAAYRAVLERSGCRVIAERKNPVKLEASFLVIGPRGAERQALETLVENGVDAQLRGSVDWRTD